ncbi:MAG: hypothetical protein Q8Q39_04095 [bacterium]|nr:hypothetical protein [bacterium]
MEYSRTFFDDLRNSATNDKKIIPSFGHLVGKSVEIIFTDPEDNRERTGHYSVVEYLSHGLFVLENDRGICLIDVDLIRYLCEMDEGIDVGF